MVSISVDRSRISTHYKATVTVTSDTPFKAYEARGSLADDKHGRGTGFCLLGDDADAVNGVVTLPSAVNTVSFDVESAELCDIDGDYRISVFTMDENGVWDDTCVLLTASDEELFGSDGKKILAKRNGSGADESYMSAYSGEQINNFVNEVLR